MSPATVLSSLAASAGDVSRSRALFHDPEWIGVWLIFVRFIVSASGWGQMFLHAPQNVQVVWFMWILLFSSSVSVPGIGQMSMHSVQVGGHFCVFMLMVPSIVFLTFIAPWVHFCSQSLHVGHSCLFMMMFVWMRFCWVGVRFWVFWIGLPSYPVFVTVISFSGHAVSHSTQSFSHLVVFIWMSRVSCG